MTVIVEWLLVVLLPVLIVSAVTRLVFVKVEARWRRAAEAKERLDNWLRTSERLQSIENAVRKRLEVESEDGHLGKDQVLHFVRVRILRLSMAWVTLKAWPGRYLNRTRYAEIRRNKEYISAREQEYKRHKAYEWAALRKQLKTNVSLEAILGKNGSMVLLGIATTVLAGGLGWSLKLSNESSVATTAVPIATAAVRIAIVAVPIAVVAVPMAAVFFWRRNSMAVYYSLGCAVVIYLGLSTLEVGPLGQTPLKEVVDAQKVSAMFVGVAIVLSLCEILVQVGEKRIGQFERYVIEYAEKATIWGRVLHPMRAAMPRVEAMWTFVALAVFLLSFVHFVFPLFQVTWSESGTTNGNGMRAMVVADDGDADLSVYSVGESRKGLAHGVCCSGASGPGGMVLAFQRWVPAT